MFRPLTLSPLSACWVLWIFMNCWEVSFDFNRNPLSPVSLSPVKIEQRWIIFHNLQHVSDPSPTACLPGKASSIRCLLRIWQSFVDLSPTTCHAEPVYMERHPKSLSCLFSVPCCIKLSFSLTVHLPARFNNPFSQQSISLSSSLSLHDMGSVVPMMHGIKEFRMEQSIISVVGWLPVPLIALMRSYLIELIKGNRWMHHFHCLCPNHCVVLSSYFCS